MKGQADYMSTLIWVMVVIVISAFAFYASTGNLFVLEGDIAKISLGLTTERVGNMIEMNEVDYGSGTVLNLENRPERLWVDEGGRQLNIEDTSGEETSRYIGTMTSIDEYDLDSFDGSSVCILSEDETVYLEDTDACSTSSCSEGACREKDGYGMYCQGGTWTRKGYFDNCLDDPGDTELEIEDTYCPDESYTGQSFACGVTFNHKCEAGETITVTIEHSSLQEETEIECTGELTTGSAYGSFSYAGGSVSFEIDSPTRFVSETESITEISGNTQGGVDGDGGW